MRHDQRRYPRVQVQTEIAECRGELAAQMTWPNLEMSSITDLSYRGAAALRPALFPFAAQQMVELHVALGLAPSFKTMARIVWFNLEMVGVEFNDLPPEGHLAMTEYLDAKLLGQSLRPVQSQLIHGGVTFDQWLHGPGDTSVFVWMKNPVLIDQVHVDIGDQAVQFVRDRKITSLTSAQRKALLILSQMDKPDLPMKEFVRSIVTGV